MRSPTTILGLAAGRITWVTRIRRPQAVAARHVERLGVDTAHAVDRVEQHRPHRPDGDDRDLGRVAEAEHDEANGSSRGGGIERTNSVTGWLARRSRGASPISVPDDDAERRREQVAGGEPPAGWEQVAAHLLEQPVVPQAGDDVATAAGSRVGRAVPPRSTTTARPARRAAPASGPARPGRVAALRRGGAHGAAAARASRGPSCRWLGARTARGARRRGSPG